MQVSLPNPSGEFGPLSKDYLIKRFGGPNFETVVSRVWHCAENWGNESNIDDEMSQSDFEIISDMTEYLFESYLDEVQKIELLFELYKDIPSYTLMLECAISCWPLSSQALSVYWAHYLDILETGNDALCWALEYQLWSGHFEKPEIRKTWHILTGDISKKNAIRRILGVSGPVPFELKNVLYQKTLPNIEFHQSIYQSIAGSTFDVYGDGSQKDLLDIFDQLTLDPADIPDWHWVKKRLSHLDEYREVKRQRNLDGLVDWLDIHEREFRHIKS